MADNNAAGAVGEQSTQASSPQRLSDAQHAAAVAVQTACRGRVARVAVARRAELDAREQECKVRGAAAHPDTGMASMKASSSAALARARSGRSTGNGNARAPTATTLPAHLAHGDIPPVDLASPSNMHRLPTPGSNGRPPNSAASISLLLDEATRSVRRLAARLQRPPSSVVRIEPRVSSLGTQHVGSSLVTQHVGSSHDQGDARSSKCAARAGGGGDHLTAPPSSSLAHTRGRDAMAAEPTLANEERFERLLAELEGRPYTGDRSYPSWWRCGAALGVGDIGDIGQSLGTMPSQRAKGMAKGGDSCDVDESSRTPPVLHGTVPYVVRTPYLVQGLGALPPGSAQECLPPPPAACPQLAHGMSPKRTIVSTIDF